MTADPRLWAQDTIFCTKAFYCLENCRQTLSEGHLLYDTVMIKHRTPCKVFRNSLEGRWTYECTRGPHIICNITYRCNTDKPYIMIPLYVWPSCQDRCSKGTVQFCTLQRGGGGGVHEILILAYSSHVYFDYIVS